MFAHFNPDINGKLLRGVIYRLASISDASKISKITFEREGLVRNKDFKYYLERTREELENIETATDFHLIVAEYKGEIIGYGRSIYYDLRKIQVTYPAPSGWYLMGLVVKPEFRRHGIGHRITEERLTRLSKRSNKVYCVVNSNNKAAVDLYEKSGFRKVDEGEGFLKIKFDGGKGYLFKRDL